MKSKTRRAVQSMVNALQRFNDAQSTDRICEDDWDSLCDYIRENDTITWNEVTHLKNVLESFVQEAR